MILQRWVFLLMMLLLVAAITGATANPDVRDGCQERCGDVIVPYPFGIGEQRCAMNENFFLHCNSTDDGHHELWFGENMPARNISLPNGTVTVGILASFDCYDKSGRQSLLFNQSISLGSGPFTFSNSRNMFTAVGCDTIAIGTNEEATSGFGCLSLCTVNATMSKENSCLGSGCCQTLIPKGLKSLDIIVQSFSNHTDVSEFNPCGFAFLEDKASLDLSDWQLSRTPKLNDTSNVVIEWVAQTETCENARANKSSYACGINSNCYYSDNGQGYRCACNEGFEGNPYLEKGCQDIDECKDPKKYTCHGKCHNTIGDYECKCSLGMGGDGKVGCRGFGIITIIISVVVGVVGMLLLLIGGWWLYRIMEKRKSNELKQKFFRQNGGLLLQQQYLSSGDQSGISKTKVFSSEELETATDGFNVNRILGQGGQGTVFKGMLADGVIVAVKRSTMVSEENLEGFINEVCILSQINQRNISKLLKKKKSKSMSSSSSIITLQLLLFFIVVPISSLAKKPHVIHFRSPNLYPEGIAYDPSAQHFIVGSLHHRTLHSVSDAGLIETIISDLSLPPNTTILGLAVDKLNNRLLAAIHSDPPLPPFNALAAYDLRSRQRLFLSLLPSTPSDDNRRPVANAVTVDFKGNAYVTNSLGYPEGNFIWKVNPEGEASIFSRSPLFTQFPVDRDAPYSYCGLNGIAYVSKGYLLVVQSNTGKLFKVDAHDGTAQNVLLNEDLPVADGIAIRGDGVVLVVSHEKLWFLKSDDSWGEGVVYDKTDLDVERFATSVVVGREDRAYVLYGSVLEGITGNGGREWFGIEEVRSEKENEDGKMWVYVLIGLGLAYFLIWRFQMKQLVKNMDKKTN